jgi:hypothetical protein
VSRATDAIDFVDVRIPCQRDDLLGYRRRTRKIRGRFQFALEVIEHFTHPCVDTRPTPSGMKARILRVWLPAVGDLEDPDYVKCLLSPFKARNLARTRPQERLSM